MLNLICPKCKIPMMENALLTAFEYNKEMKLLMSKEGKLDVANAPKYLVYSCYKCHAARKVSFDEYFTSHQELALKTAGKVRSDTSISKLTINFKEENGMSFCGVCPGLFDGDGYCSNDIIASCIVRRQILEN